MCLIERLMQPLRNLDLHRAAAAVVITQSINDGVTEIRWRRDGIDGDADAARQTIKQCFIAWCRAETAATATDNAFINGQNGEPTATATSTTAASTTSAWQRWCDDCGHRGRDRLQESALNQVRAAGGAWHRH
jgi:hypothetical protein